MGLANDTVVVFSSDHGPEEPYCGDPSTHGGVADFGSTGCARGDKHTFLDGGIKIPFIVRYPGHVPAGESACTTSHVDILPTVCALAGIKAPKPIDGTSVLDVWLNRRTQSSPSCSNRTKPLLWAGHQDMLGCKQRAAQALACQVREQPPAPTTAKRIPQHVVAVHTTASPRVDAVVRRAKRPSRDASSQLDGGDEIRGQWAARAARELDVPALHAAAVAKAASSSVRMRGQQG